MTGHRTDAQISHIDRLDLEFRPKPWPFAGERRAEIDAHFAALQKRKPAVWNGRVLLLHEMDVKGGHFRGAYLETDFASFRAWDDWGCPPAGVSDCFAAAAIVCADDAWLVGVMGPQTANAGKCYFPCGTPDRNDIINGRVDLDLSVSRELTEETGLAVGQFDAEPGWTMVATPVLIAQIKVLRAPEPAIALRERLLAHLAAEKEPELSDIRIVRGAGDLDATMPPFVTGFLRDRWASIPGLPK